MQIRQASHPLKFQNREQVDRSEMARGRVKVSEKDIQDHLSIRWNSHQLPSQLISKEGDRFKVSNFHWGFREEGAPLDWQPQFATTETDASKVKEIYLTLQPFAPKKPFREKLASETLEWLFRSRLAPPKVRDMTWSRA